MRLDSSVSNTLKEERKLGEANSKGDLALSEELKQESHSAILRKTQVRALGGAVRRLREKTHWVRAEAVCVSSIEWAKTQRDIQPFESMWRDREKHSESVRE